MARREELTDEQWAILEPLMPPLPRRPNGRGRPWREGQMVRFSQAKRLTIQAFAVLTFLLLFSIGALRAEQQNQSPSSGPLLSAQRADDSELSRVLRERLIIARALKEASSEFNIPLPILQAIAFKQSRWNHLIPSETERPQKEETPGLGTRIHYFPFYGPMGLSDDESVGGPSLSRAASLIGEEPEKLKRNPIANIRGGAALLAAIADEERRAGQVVNSRLETWKHVVEKFGGFRFPDIAELFAVDVFKTIRDGYHAHSIEIKAHPDLDMSMFSEKALKAVGIKKNP